MFDHPFWQYSGFVLWTIIITYVLIRVIWGKNWPIKLGSTLFLGPGLKNSLKKLVKEFRQKDIQDETLTEVGVYVFWRLTRLGMIGLLIAGLPVWLLMQQNDLIYAQNELFEFQNTKVNEQTNLLKSQDKKFGVQNDLIREQTKLLQSQDRKFGKQNELIARQNSLFASQNGKLDLQTDLVQEQNALVTSQNERIDSQLELMSGQNLLVDTQNNLLNLQNNLSEAGRRSSLIFLMSNVLDKVDEEIKFQKDSIIRKHGKLPKNIEYDLSNPLIGRIIALSIALRPYRFLVNDTLTKSLLSPERGHLFTALMQSKLDSRIQSAISSGGDFSNSLIGKATLRSVYLKDANLTSADFSGSDLKGSNFRNAQLDSAKFIGANLREVGFFFANLVKANLSKANLTGASFHGANLRYANLSGADFSHSNLFTADFSYTNLRNAKFLGTKFRPLTIKGADLSYAYFRGTEYLSLKELEVAKSLYKCKNLDPELEKRLKEKRPCLFTIEGCEIEP